MTSPNYREAVRFFGSPTKLIEAVARYRITGEKFEVPQDLVDKGYTRAKLDDMVSALDVNSWVVWNSTEAILKNMKR